MGATRNRSRATDGEPPASVAVTATQAQNGFGQLLSAVARDEVVTITVRNEKKAVMMSFDRYEALMGVDTSDLAALTAEFDEMVSRMQTSADQEGVDDLFAATPEELSRSSFIGHRHHDS